MTKTKPMTAHQINMEQEIGRAIAKLKQHGYQVIPPGGRHTIISTDMLKQLIRMQPPPMIITGEDND